MNDTIAPSDTEQAERMKAVWYAFGAIDVMPDHGRRFDGLDAHNFAILYGTFHKMPGVMPTIAFAWAAYVDLRRSGTTHLSADTLAAHAATVALRTHGYR